MAARSPYAPYSTPAAGAPTDAGDAPTADAAPASPGGGGDNVYTYELHYGEHVAKVDGVVVENDGEDGAGLAHEPLPPYAPSQADRWDDLKEATGDLVAATRDSVARIGGGLATAAIAARTGIATAVGAGAEALRERSPAKLRALLERAHDVSVAFDAGYTLHDMATAMGWKTLEPLLDHCFTKKHLNPRGGEGVARQRLRTLVREYGLTAHEFRSALRMGAQHIAVIGPPVVELQQMGVDADMLCKWGMDGDVFAAMSYSADQWLADLGLLLIHTDTYIRARPSTFVELGWGVDHLHRLGYTEDMAEKVWIAGQPLYDEFVPKRGT